MIPHALKYRACYSHCCGPGLGVMGWDSSPHHISRSCAAWRWWCKPLLLLAASTFAFALMEQGLGLEFGLGTAFGFTRKPHTRSCARAAWR